MRRWFSMAVALAGVGALSPRAWACDCSPPDPVVLPDGRAPAPTNARITVAFLRDGVVTLRRADRTEVPVRRTERPTVTGSLLVLVPEAPLEARTRYTVELGEAGSGAFETREFTTGDAVDTRAPEWAGPASALLRVPTTTGAGDCASILPTALFHLPAHDDIPGAPAFLVWTAPADRPIDYASTPDSLLAPPARPRPAPWLASTGSDCAWGYSSGGAEACDPPRVRLPGYGESRRIGFRAIDSAGNLGAAREVVLHGQPPRPRPPLDLDALPAPAWIPALRPPSTRPLPWWPWLATGSALVAFSLASWLAATRRRTALRPGLRALGAALFCAGSLVVGTRLVGGLVGERLLRRVHRVAAPSRDFFDGLRDEAEAWRRAQARAPDAARALRGRALAHYRSGCRRGDGEACARHARVVGEGVVGQVERNSNEALTTLHRACDLGSITGCGDLAFALAEGAREADRPRAVALARDACEHGHPRACAVMAALAPPGDSAALVRWRARACEAGHPDSCLDGEAVRSRGASVVLDPARRARLQGSVRAAARRACELGYLDECGREHWIIGDAWEPPVHATGPAGACLVGYPEACVDLVDAHPWDAALLDAPFSPERARRFVAAACLARSSTACQWLGSPEWLRPEGLSGGLHERVRAVFYFAEPPAATQLTPAWAAVSSRELDGESLRAFASLQCERGECGWCVPRGRGPFVRGSGPWVAPEVLARACERGCRDACSSLAHEEARVPSPGSSERGCHAEVCACEVSLDCRRFPITVP